MFSGNTQRKLNQIKYLWPGYLSKKEENCFKYETSYSKNQRDLVFTIYHSNFQEAMNRPTFKNGYITVREHGWIWAVLPLGLQNRALCGRLNKKEGGTKEITRNALRY